MVDESHQRIVLLNWLTSRSISRAPHEHKLPLHSAGELLALVKRRFDTKSSIEYFGKILQEDTEDDGDEELDGSPFHGAGLDFMFLRDMKLQKLDGVTYAVFLFAYVNQRVTSLPVVHTRTLTGREIQGEADERGVTTAHMVVRLPAEGDFDDGTYRCSIESVPGVTRRNIGHFLRRQMAKAIGKEKWTFDVVMPGKKGRDITKTYRYWPRLDLLADVGRALSAVDGQQRTLTQLVFTKRAERQELAGPTSVNHEDFVADVEIRVNARQGPADPAQRTTWWSRIRSQFESRGFETKLYYRNLNGARGSADIHHSLDSAADLMMCPRDVIELPYQPKVSLAEIDDTVTAKMIALIEKDQLWERRR